MGFVPTTTIRIIRLKIANSIVIIIIVDTDEW